MATELIETYDSYGVAIVVEPPFASWSDLGNSRTTPSELANQLLELYYTQARAFPRIWSSIFLSAYLINQNFSPAASRKSHTREGRDMIYLFVPGIEAGPIRPRPHYLPLNRMIRHYRRHQISQEVEMRGLHQGLSISSGFLDLANSPTIRS